MEGTAEAAAPAPPVYTNEEEPTNNDDEGGTDNNLPYPVINSDPAYPPILNSYSTDI